jgi:hypothetical protein
MLRMVTTAAMLLMFGTASEAASQKPDAALRAALYKGYTGAKAKCYADVSRRYYTPGTLTSPGGRRTAGI